MRETEFSEQDAALLADSQRLLARQRAARDTEAQRAFTARVMTAVANETPSKRGIWRARRIWQAAALVAVVLVAILILNRGASYEERMFRARLAAEKHPISRAAGPIAHPSWFAEHEGERLVAIRYDHGSEQCLWLYTEADIADWEANAPAEELARHPRWRVGVAGGQLEVPEEALIATFGSADNLVLMDFDAHYEIWAAAALDRHLSRVPAAD